MSEEDVIASLIAFIRERFLAGDDSRELSDTTPLLAWGILDSFNTAVLLAFIRDGLGVSVPAGAVNAGNFGDVRSIAALVCSSATVSGEAEGA